jgi:hypothetical protein
MAADLESIIANTIQEATDTGALPEAEGAEGEVDVSGQESGQVEEPVKEEVVEGVEVIDDKTPAKEAAKPSEEEAEFQAILKELGINPPKEGRDNRMPYSRHLKTLVNSVKKDRARLTGDHTKALSEREAKIKEAQESLARFNEVDQVIASDPEKYIGILAALYPEKYKRFLTPAETKVEKKAETEPAPEPDLKYQDGTVGFSPEQWAKREAWNRREATREAEEHFKAELEKQRKELEPLINDRRASAIIQQRLPAIRANIASAQKTWGEELYKANEEAIVKALNEEDVSAQREKRAPATFAAVVASVLVPKLNERINKTRENVIEELKKAPKAASGLPAKSTKAVADPDVTRETVDVVREALAASGLKG